ncbi:DUF2778 domain-containing protein [Lichenihabitans sp. Uapishka_5]|uniref:DUF2778 domain-containing protein n=1 Tax=Lichenihabitans sp. Uapishka_5 TaxID=3037302 RepID=UPI0029E7DA4C|nr:DUF2778 domain-containing protein [Lichenihabitans sp. Uapishka_5]MDX7950138.1 DUF2778 domain-containing protein [Lichenihabitans sp. Uapishka_5]
MTDATFYTAYDDMPPVIRLRRGRKARRSGGAVAPRWVLATGLTIVSALPALAPGHRHGPAVVAQTPSPLQTAAALPMPPQIATGPLLQAAYLAGAPLGFDAAAPLPTRFISADTPVITATAEAAAPTPQRAALVASAVEPATPGPQAMAAADQDDDEAILPPVRTTPLIVADVPVPMPRPSDFAPTVTHLPPFRADRPVVATAKTMPPAARPTVTADNRGFLEKFFSMGGQAPATPALGYAAPEDGFFSSLRGGGENPTRGYGSATAVYEIASHTVFMPDGSRLEAHSGLGARLDDPRFVHERMRGPTPPATYSLTMRESLFHGVQALRLSPIDSGVYGRNGLLAHTYMLGPKGDSNGCVSFRNYQAFLRAFQSGDIRRLVVVAKLS